MEDHTKVHSSHVCSRTPRPRVKVHPGSSFAKPRINKAEQDVCHRGDLVQIPMTPYAGSEMEQSKTRRRAADMWQACVVPARIDPEWRDFVALASISREKQAVIDSELKSSTARRACAPQFFALFCGVPDASVLKRKT